MKKLSIAALLVIASLTLVACGGGGSSSSSEEPATSGGRAEAEESEASGTGKGAGGEEEPEEGGGKEAESGSASAALDYEASPSGELMFSKTATTAKAGDDTIDFTNPSSTPHNVAIEDSSGKKVAETETITEGSTSATADLKPGTYTYFCSIPGHREAGMEGTITVK